MTKFDVWSWRTVRVLLSGALTVALAACGGGGGGAGTPVVGPGSGASSPSTAASAVAADLVVVLNKTTMTNSGTDSITATVTSIDANRAAIGSVPVSFSVNANAVVTPSGTATDAKTGALTATITQGSDSTVRPVNLTVTSGSVSRVVTFNVVQNSSPTNPQANDLNLSLSATSILNAGSNAVVATATAVDASRNALSGIPVQLAVSDSSASIIVPSNQTNASGQVTGTVNIGQDRTNRTITVTATSGTLVRTAAFEVTGTKFSQASPVPAVVNAGGAGTVQYTVADNNGNALAGVSIAVSGSGITAQSGTTDLNGNYTFNYTAPNTPGATLTINALAGGVPSSVSVTIPGGTTTVPTATTPVSTTLNLSANVIAVNTDRTNNQIAVSAFFRDGSNAPISNVRVLFGVTGDNQTGTIGSGTNAVLSDASGSASTNYKSGGVSSPTNGVTILACWKTTDFASTDTVANCTTAGGQLLKTTLTIVSNPVSISIGTDNTIALGASTLTYVKKYVVLVVDSAGNPKAGVQVTPSVDLGGYGKGYWKYNLVTQVWERSPGYGSMGLLTATCPNEDLNRNGVIDSGEDVNGNQQLDPRKSDVSVTLVGSTTTDANGVAVLQLEYPQNVASWVKYKITVTAAGVLSPPAYFPLGQPVSLPSQSLGALLGSGTPSPVENYLYTYDWLPVRASDLGSATVAPAFALSPYGVAADCTSTK
ncbi:beta strand repeat-containing protein [Pelomonas aquatica]